mgnify:CR=1 FL=1
MRQLFNLISAVAVGAALLAPLVYAVGTLGGMQHKKVYPLLRYRSHDGVFVIVQTV